MKKCPLCDGALSTKTVTHTLCFGDVTTKDETMQARTCALGHYVLTEEQEAIALLRAARVALHESKSVSGATFRDARKAIGLTQTQVAELLDTTAETLSRYENEHAPIPRTVQLALAELAAAIERANGDVEAAWPESKPQKRATFVLRAPAPARPSRARPSPSPPRAARR